MRNPASRRKRAQPVLIFALLLALSSSAVADQPGVPIQYRKFFVHYVDRRSLSEKALNTVGLTSSDIGRSFALVAGVANYPNLPQKDRILAPAAVDLRKVVSYLRDVELFDEIVVLRNEAVTDQNLKFFLQSYFPERLSKFPRSRFLFAYSGHGIQDGPRGYLLQASAVSFEDKAHSISLEVLRTLYGEIVDSAHQSLALINACHSGAFEKRAFGTRRLVPREPGAHVITAGGSRELAWHDPRVGPGSLLFEKLFAGLEGRADLQPLQPDGTTGDGVITVPELWAYLSEEIQIATDQRQSPLASDISRHGSAGSFFFLHRGREVRAGVIQPWDPDQTGAISSGPRTASESPRDRIARQAEQTWGDGRQAEATRLFQEACDLGVARSCLRLAFLYFSGEAGLPADQAKALAMFQKACDGGDTTGCAVLAKMYEEGMPGLAADPARAVALYGKSCDAGEALGCGSLGYMQLKGEGGLKADPAKAAALFRKACDGGDARACAFLASLTEDGEGGLTRDLVLARQLYQTSCDAKYMSGCIALGRFYEKGLGGLPADAEKAAELYSTACDQGEARACAILGQFAMLGQGGVAFNPARAIELFRKACDAGDGIGCAVLAYCFEHGIGGMEVDVTRAREFYQKACKAGIEDSCRRLTPP